MVQIDYFFSTVSSYSYVAGDRLEQLAARQGAVINYVPIDIVAMFDETGGLLPKNRHPARQAYRARDLVRSAANAGLQMNIDAKHRATDDKPSSCAIIAAQRAGGGDVGALIRHFLYALWWEEHDIARRDVIESCLERSGFDLNAVALDAPDLPAAYANHTSQAIERGVFGAPFYIVPETGEPFWGQDRLRDLEAYIASRS